jgi:hypothetical protein
MKYFVMVNTCAPRPDDTLIAKAPGRKGLNRNVFRGLS